MNFMCQINICINLYIRIFISKAPFQKSIKNLLFKPELCNKTTSLYCGLPANAIINLNHIFQNARFKKAQ